MAENQEHHDEGHEDGGHDVNYKKIYLTLVVLLIISVIGPHFGILAVTLVTAFGVALWKADLVIQNFMHLKWERRLMKWVLTTSLVLMALMIAGVSTDVLNHEGRNWENVAARAAIERGIEGPEEEGESEEFVPPPFSAETTFNTICATCHGSAGDGTGPAGAALDPPPANFTDPEFWATRDRARIVDVITHGAAAVFGGSAQMVAWSANFNAEQIDQLADRVMEFRPE